MAVKNGDKVELDGRAGTVVGVHEGAALVRFDDTGKLSEKIPVGDLTEVAAPAPAVGTPTDVTAVIVEAVAATVAALTNIPGGQGETTPEEDGIREELAAILREAADNGVSTGVFTPEAARDYVSQGITLFDSNVRHIEEGEDLNSFVSSLFGINLEGPSEQQVVDATSYLRTFTPDPDDPEEPDRQRDLNNRLNRVAQTGLVNNPEMTKLRELGDQLITTGVGRLSLEVVEANWDRLLAGELANAIDEAKEATRRQSFYDLIEDEIKPRFQALANGLPVVAGAPPPGAEAQAIGKALVASLTDETLESLYFRYRMTADSVLLAAEGLGPLVGGVGLARITLGPAKYLIGDIDRVIETATGLTLDSPHFLLVRETFFGVTSDSLLRLQAQVRTQTAVEKKIRQLQNTLDTVADNQGLSEARTHMLTIASQALWDGSGDIVDAVLAAGWGLSDLDAIAAFVNAEASGLLQDSVGYLLGPDFQFFGNGRVDAIALTKTLTQVDIDTAAAEEEQEQADKIEEAEKKFLRDQLPPGQQAEALGMSIDQLRVAVDAAKGPQQAAEIDKRERTVLINQLPINQRPAAIALTTEQLREAVGVAAAEGRSEAERDVAVTASAQDVSIIISQRIKDLEARIEDDRFSDAEKEQARRHVAIMRQFGEGAADMFGEQVSRGETTKTAQEFVTARFPSPEAEGIYAPDPVGGPEGAAAREEAGVAPLDFSRRDIFADDITTVDRNIEAQFLGAEADAARQFAGLERDPVTGRPNFGSIKGLEGYFPSLEDFNREVQMRAVAAARRLNQETVDSVILNQAIAQELASIRGEGTIDQPGDVGATEAVAAAGRARSVTPRRTPPARVVK